MRRKPVWWTFLRIREDGWASSFENVNSLLKHLGRKSRSIASRNRYCYILWRLCKRTEMNPDKLVSKARGDPDSVASLIQDLADEYNARGSTRYANHIVHISNSFFKVNRVELDLHGYFQPSRSRKRAEYVPSLQEALKMADVAGSLRDRLIVLFLTYAGLRNSTLRALVFNEAYPDPLLQEHTVKKELETGRECLILIVHEVMKRRIPNACKNRVFYYAFIPPKVTECLRLYLREKAETYGPILDDQPIFMTKNRRIPLRQRLKTSISSRELQEIVKKLARRAGIKNWKHVYPHCLRKTYESFLRNQPDDVRLDAKEREFLFGHTLPGSQDTYFDRMKIDQIRGKYVKMIFEPITGIEKEERLCGEDELQSFLEQGWHFEANLPSGKVVVSRRTVTKQPTEVKSESKSQVFGTVDATKESSRGFSNSAEQNQLSVVNCLDPLHELRNVDYDKGLTGPPEVEPSANSKTNTEYTYSSLAVERKKDVSHMAPPDRPNKTEQKSLFDFPT